MADVEAAVAAPVEEQVADEQPAEAPSAEEEQPTEAEPKTAAKKSPKTAKKKAAHTPVTDGPSSRVKRERKQVDRFVPTTSEKEEHFEVKKGKGSKLRDIPNVAFKLGKVTGKDELAEHLHMLLYRRKGTATNRKRDILDFSGFTFEEAEEEKEMKYRRESLGKWKLDLMHRLMDALDLQRGSGDKSSKVEKVLEFLVKPEQLNTVSLADKEAEKKEKAKAKKEREAAKKEKEKAQKEKEKAKKEKEKAKKEKEKEKAKKEKEAAAKRKASAEKKGRPAKKAKKEESEEEHESEPEAEEMEVEGGGEDPAAALDAGKLRTDIEQELGGMAVEELKAVNVRLLLGKLSEKYGFDVKSRKAEVKQIAVEYCNQRLAEEEGEEEGGKEEGGEEETTAAEEEQAAPAEAAGGEEEQQPQKEQPPAEEAPAAAEEEPAAEPAAAAPEGEPAAAEPAAAAEEARAAEEAPVAAEPMEAEAPAEGA